MLQISHIIKRINVFRNKHARRTKLLLFVLVFASAGLLTLVLTWASGPRASVEPEQGAASLPAQVVTDGTASGGGYIKFGTPSSCPTPAPTTAAAYEQLIRGGIGGKKYTADSGQSTRLPNGKVLWVFGDTFVRPETQSSGGAFINNNFILVDKGCAQAVSGPNDAQGQPTSTVTPTGSFDKPGVTDYYWPNIPYIDGNTLNVFMWHMYNDDSGFHMIGQDLAQFDVSGAVPVLTSLHQTPGSANGETQPGWGSAVLRADDFTYIYGNIDKYEEWVFGKYYYVARVPNGQVASQAAWRYWDGANWVANQTAAAAVIPGTAGVGAVSSVYQRPNGSYVLVSKKFDMVGSDIVAWTASSPTGPWIESSTLIAPVPNVDTAAGEHTYFGLAHPEVPLASGKMLISWSLNSNDPGFFGGPRYGLYFGESTQP